MSLTAITTLRRNLSEWAERPANRRQFCDEQQHLLQRHLGDPGRRPQVHVAAWMLGTWHLGHGLAQVLDGNGDGFDEARTGQALRRTALLLRAEHQAGPGKRGRLERLPFSLAHGAWTALLGLALHDPAAERLYDLLLDLPDGAFGPEDQLALFARELLALRSGQRPTPGQRLGPYEPVLQHWHGERRLLAQSIAEVLELHLQQANRRGGTFDDPCLWLYPVEAVAVRHVRDWLELPSAKVEHALMFTNLGTMAPSGAWPSHPLLAGLERELRRR